MTTNPPPPPPPPAKNEDQGFVSHISEEDLKDEEEEVDIEIVANKGVDPVASTNHNVQEIACEAEEFLESEVAEARSETELGAGHKTGEVFTV